MCTSNCNHDPMDFSDLEDMDAFNSGHAAVTSSVATVEQSIERWSERGNESAQGAIYEEKCEACRGSGNFYSYTGRLVGDCFKCKGTGVRKFKTSPEQRQKNRDRAAAKKQAEVDARNAKSVKWIEENKEMFDYLMANSWNEFYKSMILKIGEYGGLTEGQYNAVKRGMDKAAAKPKAKADGIDISSLNGYYAVPNGKTRLKVRVRPGTDKWAGWFFVTDGAAYGQAQKYGNQKPGGTYSGEIVEALTAIVADPLAATIAYGKLTGTCGACGRKLEDPDSIEAGIGPVCAKKF